VPQRRGSGINSTRHQQKQFYSRRGLGIGLSLAGEIMLVHGGTLELVDCESGWTVFELKLPLA
jgi:signal transduction histidine kinase